MMPLIAGTPPAVGGTESLREPWQIILVISILSLAGILTGVAAIVAAMRSHRGAKEVKEHLLAQDATFRQNVGIANGHGTVMDQVTIIHKSVGVLNEHLFRVNEKVDRVGDGFEQMRSALDTHVAESRDYRDEVKSHLTALDAGVRLLRTDLDGHVEGTTTQGGTSS